MEKTGAKTFYLPSADYIWPHVMNKKVHELVTANGGKIVGEEYYPMDRVEYGETVEKIISNGADVVFNTIVPPSVVPFFQLLHNAGFQKSSPDREFMPPPLVPASKSTISTDLTSSVSPE